MHWRRLPTAPTHSHPQQANRPCLLPTKTCGILIMLLNSFHNHVLSFAQTVLAKSSVIIWPFAQHLGIWVIPVTKNGTLVPKITHRNHDHCLSRDTMIRQPQRCHRYLERNFGSWSWPLGGDNIGIGRHIGYPLQCFLWSHGNPCGEHRNPSSRRTGVSLHKVARNSYMAKCTRSIIWN
jgi:hypothetical protein